MNLHSYMETANILADAAAVLAHDAWLSETGTSFKKDGTPLTETDLRVEERLRGILRSRHPDHGVLGEEHGYDRGDSAFTWVIDPIDGTRQFAARLANFGVLVALCHDGAPVLGLIDQPLIKARCVAAKGTGTTFNGRPVTCRSDRTLRRSVIALANPGSFSPATRPAFDALAEAGEMIVYDGGCLGYMALARGAVDVCLNGPDLDPFDVCALVPVVEEAGGVITAWNGSRPTITYSGAIFAAGSARLHQEVRNILSLKNTRTS